MYHSIEDRPIITTTLFLEFAASYNEKVIEGHKVKGNQIRRNTMNPWVRLAQISVYFCAVAKTEMQSCL